MNRINPLYIGALLVLILGFMILKLSDIKEDYSDAKSEYKETFKIANELSGLKSVYANKAKTKKSLQKVLRNATLRASKVQTKSKKSGMSISAKSMDMKALNYLMGKVLNGTYQIDRLKIKQLSEHRVSLDMEIKW